MNAWESGFVTLLVAGAQDRAVTPGGQAVASTVAPTRNPARALSAAAEQLSVARSASKRRRCMERIVGRPMDQRNPGDYLRQSPRQRQDVRAILC